MMPRSLETHSPEEIESIMVQLLADAFYPILYPVEQQDCKIQELHHVKVTSLALRVWRDFVAMENA